MFRRNFLKLTRLRRKTSSLPPASDKVNIVQMGPQTGPIFLKIDRPTQIGAFYDNL